LEKGIITLLDQKENFDKAIEKLRAINVETIWENKVICSSRDPKVVISQARGAAYVFAGGEVWNKEVFDACPTVKLIIRLGVGYEGINLEDASVAGVPVCYMPGFNAQSVAEQAVALMLSVLRKIPYMNERMHRGDKGAANFCTTMLSGKTIGLIGSGNIGRRTAAILKAFGCRVLVYDIRVDRELEGQIGFAYAGLEKLYAESDVISLHLPMLPETRGLICAESIALMKPGVVIINTSRGGLVNSADLEEALKNGHVVGAGLDVFDDEGGQKTTVGGRFIPYENVVMTPHVSGSTQETFDAMMDQAIKTVELYRQGGELPNLLNPGWKKSLH
jgi:phosphoglycerate dehydrogenase-like enzyme